MNKISWLTLSNALVKSQKIAMVNCFLLTASAIWFRKWTIGCMVECAFWKPYWCLNKTLKRLRNSASRLATSFSRIFEKIVRNNHNENIYSYQTGTLCFFKVKTKQWAQRNILLSCKKSQCKYIFLSKLTFTLITMKMFSKK